MREPLNGTGLGFLDELLLWPPTEGGALGGCFSMETGCTIAAPLGGGGGGGGSLEGKSGVRRRGGSGKRLRCCSPITVTLAGLSDRELVPTSSMLRSQSGIPSGTKLFLRRAFKVSLPAPPDLDSPLICGSLSCPNSMIFGGLFVDRQLGSSEDVCDGKEA